MRIEPFSILIFCTADPKVVSAVSIPPFPDVADRRVC
jgi:hypothetical protein